ncbi:PIG-L deacetylase family protein [Solimicrobium silvestre]|uniref:Putative LmbE-like protein n=1 Tax=Solimicrobium silvestre TaxID=2099400 RepID=A0A2S9GUZ6_9BURK|nr:PIG-L deacetylase family protein [Solimicrobium silvestre]PRC91476.1 putative LmbE -like protein [Solimicrobium silvestre]
MTRKVLVIATHPDDETLGCGGTLLKHQAENHEVYWLICTSMSEKNGYTLESLETRTQEINDVASVFNFKEIYHLGLDSMQVDTYAMSEIIAKIASIIKQVEPHTIYLPFKSDVHSDHRKIFEAAYSCTKSFRYPFIKRILMMETLSETEFAPSTKEDSFIPNVFVDISAYFEKKCAILRIYKSEMGVHPFPRSERNVTALATLRGATAACEYAESFVLLKEIS